MEMSGQLHTPVILFLEKKLPVPTVSPRASQDTLAKRKTPLTLLGIEPYFLHCPVCSLVTILIKTCD